MNIRIERDIMKDLLRWKQRPDHKPLIIRGARQIGKTWVMRRFGEKYFDHVAYFNFDLFSAFFSAPSKNLPYRRVEGRLTA